MITKSCETCGYLTFDEGCGIRRQNQCRSFPGNWHHWKPSYEAMAESLDKLESEFIAQEEMTI